MPAADEIVVDGFVDGYVLDRPMSARQALEPLAQAFGFDATMSAGRLRFRGRAGTIARRSARTISCSMATAGPMSCAAPQESELPLELRLAFSDGESDYRAAAARSRRLAGAAGARSASRRRS